MTRRDAGEADPAEVPPFFIVGAPRTGTTLLRRLLSAHSRIAIPTESGFMVDYLAAEHVPLARRKRLLAEEPEIGYWGIELTRRELEPLPTIGACFDHAHRKYAAADGKDLWGNKTPKLVRATELLRAHFPGCRFVHVVRDGRAVADSLRRSPAHRLHPYYGARRYARDAALGLALEEARPECVRRVPYEALVDDPASILRGLCDFLGVAFEPAMVEGAADLRLTPAERRAGHHARVTRPIDRSSTERWRSELSWHEVALVEHVAGESMRRLGYALEAEAPTPTLRDRLPALWEHGRRTLGKAVEEVTQRPDVWRVARRRLALGSFRSMVREHLRGQ